VWIPTTTTDGSITTFSTDKFKFLREKNDPRGDIPILKDIHYHEYFPLLLPNSGFNPIIHVYGLVFDLLFWGDV